MSRWLIIAILLGLPFTLNSSAPKKELKAGFAAIAITPFGQNSDWDGTVTDSGVWGEKFTDTNKNGYWDRGEPFEDDDSNSQIDASAKDKYDGIYLAGFGTNRLATGKHDDLWARTMVLNYGSTRIAIVAVDLIGYYSDGSYYGIKEVKKLLDPKLGIQEVLVAATHNHEGPDSIGVYGDNFMKDGKYPKYLRFVDRMIAKSIATAAQGLQPAKFKIGTTDPTQSPSIAGMQVRNGGRPPKFFDEEMRVMQFINRQTNKTIGTFINWNTHPESMEDKNREITSDFIHAAREMVEQKFGGTAVYVSGPIGAVEIVGDSNTKNTDRIKFDGQDFALKPNSTRPVFTHERTAAIGRDIGKAAIEALAKAEWSKSTALAMKKADLRVPMDNQGYLLLLKLGVLDTAMAPDESGQPQSRTTIYAIDLGDAQIVTTPGELFPEIYYGLDKYRRNDCPSADTGAPIEPGIRGAMTKKYRFMLGLCPDEFGYIVPAHDFRREPIDLKNPQIKKSPDVCKAQGVPDHYHETNSASSVMAPASACVTVALLTGKMPSDAACKDVAKYSEYVKRLPTR
ncbi:MAG: neutral/alkaline non-lysosomal ceramidase N-terminal domain-containing protein [Acidobacteria bacterium]|nr:neutral/alkaline non-lysosomal ceramidase N-terminal domain-containing protein [Acidobacteriota bacterium]